MYFDKGGAGVFANGKNAELVRQPAFTDKGGDKLGLKNRRLEQLREAFAEAEENRLEEQHSHSETDLRTLLLEFLTRDTSPQRRILLEAMERGAPLAGPEGIRKKLAAFDLEFFGRAYFDHYFSTTSPDFHRELDDIWHQGVMKGLDPYTKHNAKKVNTKSGCRWAVAAPRGHAKSTTLTFKGSMHAALYAYKHYIIILSDSSEQAEGFLESIRVEMEENEAIAQDFGLLAGNVWRSNVLLTKNNVKIEAIGSGKKIRGRKHRNWRPDLIVLDDVENDDNVRTPEQRQKLLNWYMKAVAKCGDRYTDIILIGTLLHYDALLANLLKKSTYKTIKYKAVLAFSNADKLWDEWEKLQTDLDDPDHEGTALRYFEAHREEMLAGTKVLWEAKNSYYELMVAKISDGDAAFNSELQNEPINPDDCIFIEEWFDYYNEAEVDFSDKAFQFFGFVDPSLGKSKKSDFSAIITLAKHKVTGYMYVADADIMRRHPDQIIRDVLEKEIWLRKTFGRGYKKFGAETNQFQWFLKEELAKASARAGLYLPIVEIQQTSDKIMRIQTLQPDIKNKYIKLNRRHKLLNEQLMYFPMGAHDDGPDALEGCRTLAKKTRKFRTMKKSAFGL